MVRAAPRLLVLTLALSLFPAAFAEAAPRFRPVEDDIFYTYMPIAWRDSDGDTYRYGDFGGMSAAIPYLKSLGVSAVWMNPIFISPAYHGYQHGRADSLNPRFGSEAEFWSFVAAAHAESIKVLIDFVAYGISQNTPWFQDSYANPSSLYDDWLSYTNAGNTSYLGCCPYSTWDGATVGFIHWDLRTPEVTQQVVDWAVHWLDPNADGNPSDGIDGFRLDHVSAYNSDESPWGYDLAWWLQWKALLQLVNPDVFSVAEQADWGWGAELLPAHDAVVTKQLEFAARFSLSRENAGALAGTMSTTLSLIPTGKLNLATIGDHDVDRLATVLGDVPGRLRAAASVLMLQPLPPVIYFGDELGMRGAKRNDFSGDAKDIPFREPFKWNAVAGAPMSNYFVRNSQAYADRVEQDLDGRSVEEQNGAPGSLLERYRALGGLRRAHPGLRRGSYTPVSSPDTAIWAFVKVAPEETLIVAVNLGASALSTTLALSGFQPEPGGSEVTNVESGAALTAVTSANRTAYPLSIGAYEHRVLRSRLTPRDLRLLYQDANLVLTQDSPSLIGDHLLELDQMFVRFDSAGIALGITGNMLDGGHSLMLFFDALPGGQTTLQTSSMPQPPSVLPALSNLTFDPGFQPEAVLALNSYSGILYADLYTLATVGGGSKRYLGSIPVGAEGTLAGGSNPNWLRASYSPGNRAGISSGTAVGAETATDGFEILMPWADLGLAGAGPPLKLLATLVISDGYLINQFLPGLQGHNELLGYTPLDLGNFPGTYLSIGSTTGIAASLVSSRATSDVVELMWQVEERGAEFAIERGEPPGAWTWIATLNADGAGVVSVLDRDVVPGRRYGYRLLAAGSTRRVLAEIWIDVPLESRLALRAIAPNPSAGPMNVWFDLEGGAPASVTLFDLGGRRVLTRDVRVFGAGSHRLALNETRRLSPGVYVVELREGARVRRARAAVIR